MHSWLQNLEDLLCLKFFSIWLLLQNLRSTPLLLCNETANIIQDSLCQVIAVKIIFDSQVKIKLHWNANLWKVIFFRQKKIQDKIVVCEKKLWELFCRYSNWIILLQVMLQLIEKKEILCFQDNFAAKNVVKKLCFFNTRRPFLGRKMWS